jgi:2-amino-4-hydroxy-6-hydroxymethyldihydropteridine diphosphokinase
VARATVALGSNLGDRLAQLRAGVAGLGRLGEVVAVSSLFETEPVGGPPQGRYLNAVVLLETELEPEELLAGLHQIEGDSDRTRDVHWGPRTLDLDLITYNSLRVDLDHLTIPHPRAHERRFVLAPLSEVSPDAVLANGLSPADAAGSVSNQKITRWRGSWLTESPQLGPEAAWWVTGQFSLLVIWLIAVVVTGRPGGLASTVIGAVVAIGGFAMGLAAVSRFGRQVVPSPQPSEGAELVDSGIYSRVRHPMYGAVITTTTGVAIASRSWWAVALSLVIAAFLRFKSDREEKILEIAVSGYSEYRASVRRRFIPAVW